MRTIKITITSPNPPDIVITEQEPDVLEKLGELLLGRNKEDDDDKN